jgi:UDP-glucose 4-epimerase
MSNILVAGGAGFIGSHLVDKLLEEGNNVIVADKLVFGKRNIQHLLDDKELNLSGRFKFYQMELADVQNTDILFNENRIDMVYHLAANSDIQKGGKEPSIDWNDTMCTTRALLESMRKSNVRKLFFASTSAIYGEILDKALNETTGGLKPVSYYGGAKLASEALISSYTAMCDMDVVIFRFPNVIGPRLTHGVIHDFIEKLKKNPKSLEILGNGSQCKPYIYVIDLVDVITRLTREWKLGEEVYNISVNSGGTTVTRIAEIICEELELRNVDFHYTGGDRGWKGDVPRFKYDISKVLATGWVPKHTSEEAVRQTVRDTLSEMVSGLD